MKTYQDLLRKSPFFALVFLTTILVHVPEARAGWIQNLLDAWHYRGNHDPTQNPQRWEEGFYYEPNYQGEQPQNQLPQSPPQQRFQRERVGIPLSPLTRGGLNHLLDLGGQVNDAGWFNRPFASRLGFGVDMAPGRYQMQADWNEETTVILDVDSSYNIVWMSFYFYPRNFYR